MFYPVEGGSVIEINDNAFGFVYKCHVPPIGYGVNAITGKLEFVGMPEENPVPEENYFRRYYLPKDWKQKREAEKRKQKIDQFYFDPELQEIRATEWRKRLCGHWFYNYNPFTKEVELIYITGQHYLYVNYWKFQGKYMDFRITDRDVWYVRAYCDTDPNCLGLNFLTRRRLGKSAMAGAWAYERTSRRPTNQHCGIQSKDDDGAEELFKKAIVQPWQKLPDFFRPIYDTMKGDDPSELRFFHPSRRGATTEEERENEDALESWIDYGPASESYYDGTELLTYVSDEAGKVEKKISISERQNIVRYCSENEGKIRGKQWYTSTVEVDETTADEHEFQELVHSSNPLNRNENGRTSTGLYTYFLPAHHAYQFDNIYGYPDVQAAERILLNERKYLLEEGKLRHLASAKRKNPMTLQEAFSVDGEHSLYNPVPLQEQLDLLSWGDKMTEFGNLVWKDGFEFERPIKNDFGEITGWEINQLEWVPSPTGRFEKVIGWWPREANKVYKNGSKFLPNNNYSYRIGCDPFKYDKTKDKRRSNCAAFAYQIKDELFPNDPFNDMPVLRYSARSETTRESNADILKMAWLCGCQVLFERNVNHWKRDFQDWDCDAFMMYLPGELEPGIVTDGTGKVVQMICNYTESYQNEHIKKVYYKTLIRKEAGWLGFKIEDTQKFDEPMAFGFTLIAVRGKKYRKPQTEMQSIESIMPLNKAI